MKIIEEARPAEAFPVGEYLRDELEARGWTNAEFAQIIGRPVQAVSEILNNRKEITPETATEIAAATGTVAETWLRLQDTYRLWKLSQEPKALGLNNVQRRARLANLVPLRELIKRKFVPEEDIDAQERAVCDLLDIPSLNVTPSMAIAARRSDAAGELSPAQLAWLGCVRKAGRERVASPLDAKELSRLAEYLTRTVRTPSALAELPRMLADVGVRLVHVPSFPSSKIDGAAFKDDQGVVIGLSGRIKRFDSVIFTLLHEMAHVFLRHVETEYTLDVDLNKDGADQRERDADRLASRWAIPESISLPGRISKNSVTEEAARLGLHPAILVGRLHHTGRLPWTHLRGLIPTIGDELATWE